MDPPFAPSPRQPRACVVCAVDSDDELGPEQDEWLSNHASQTVSNWVNLILPQAAEAWRRRRRRRRWSLPEETHLDVPDRSSQRWNHEVLSSPVKSLRLYYLHLLIEWNKDETHLHQEVLFTGEVVFVVVTTMMVVMVAVVVVTAMSVVSFHASKQCV